jgi:hypothetical protein
MDSMSSPPALNGKVALNHRRKHGVVIFGLLIILAVSSICSRLIAVSLAQVCRPATEDDLSRFRNRVRDVNGFNRDGTPERLAWTTAGTDDAWLVLDRTGNGLIDSGAEVFGNFTPQPDPPLGEKRNGFLALTAYDQAAQGGNGDGVLNSRDAIFTSLRLWQDANHNGVSEPGELHWLSALGVATLDLKYKESRWADEYGNQFRYRAKVKDVQGAQVGRWAWEVFLISQ